MPVSEVQGQLTPADMQAIKDAIALIESKMPFLIALTPLEAKRLFKLGPKSLAFVEDALNAAQNNPEILPASFDTPAMAADVNLSSALSDVQILLEQLTSQVTDTLAAVGSQAMEDGTTVYNYVKTAAKTTPGLKPVEQQLGERFKKAKAKPELLPPDAS